jgi:penicillin-binding protein 1C
MHYRKLIVGGSMILIAVMVLHFTFHPDHKVKSLRYSKVFYDRHQLLIGAKLSPDEKWRFEASLDSVSPCLVDALLEFEDKRFFKHFGVDLASAARALGQNISSGAVVSGASTITMQVARLLWQTHQQGLYLGKIYQTLRALQLEWCYSKAQILELYFNLAPYGKNIEGVAAASWFYFNKPPSKLNWTEAIAMSIAPKSPNRFRLDRFPAEAKAICRRVTEDLIDKGKINGVDRIFIDCDQIPGTLQQLPFSAPHLIDRLHTNSAIDSALVYQPDVAGDANNNHIITTLDKKIQLQVERLVATYLSHLESIRVPHAAAIVIDNESAEVLAYVGSPDFRQDQGQVDGVRAKRSTGSTLKPFLYALALESGKYTPQSFIPNVPLSFPGYRPQNYNKDDIGIVNFSRALQHSLNLPAVFLNAGLGRDRDLYNFLRTSGISSLDFTWEQYGQNIVLGGAELRLDELSALYVMLANGGKLKPISLTIHPPDKTSPRPLLTPEAVYIVNQILRSTPIPKYKIHSSIFRDYPDVAWKTGTSSRQRDAWTIGYSPKHTVGVWLGDFKGKSILDMSGRHLAAPLFYDIMRYLQQDGKQVWAPKPENVVLKRVCRLSGHLPNHNCPGDANTWWIAGVTDPRFCSMHSELLIDKKSGKRLSPECIKELGLKAADYQTTSGVRWPQSTATWLAANHSVTLFPEYKPGCEPKDFLNGKPPTLQTPLDGETYIVSREEEYDPTAINFGKMVFAADVNNEVQYVDWYLDDTKLGITRPGETLLWTPMIGEHRLLVVDNYGRRTTASFTVLEGVKKYTVN